MLTSVCAASIESDDDDLVYLGTGENRALIFTGRNADPSIYVEVGTDKTAGARHRAIVMMVDRRGHGLFFALQPTHRRPGEYRRIQSSSDSLIQASLVLTTLGGGGFMASVRTEARREELKEYYAMIIMQREADKKSAAKRAAKRTSRGV